MRGYGLPRVKDLDGPDMADIRRYGLKSPVFKRKSSSKRAARRVWKKRERRLGKRLLLKEAGL